MYERFDLPLSLLCKLCASPDSTLNAISLSIYCANAAAVTPNRSTRTFRAPVGALGKTAARLLCYQSTRKDLAGVA